LKSAKQINVLLEGNKLLLSSYRENIFWSGILLAYYGVLRWDSSLQGDPSLHHTGPKLQGWFCGSQAPGGCEMITIQHEISNINITMTPKLFS